MIYIAHRGNINGKNTETENSINQILECLKLDLNIEIDLWYTTNGFMLGHDEPMYSVSEEFLYKYSNKLWCHAKNSEAMFRLKKNNFHCFWHETDKYTITSRGLIWAYPGSIIDSQTICVMPETVEDKDIEIGIAHGICSDNIEYYKKLIQGV